MNMFFRYKYWHAEDDACSCGQEGCPGCDHEEDFDDGDEAWDNEDTLIEIEDMESGETFEFQLADEFEHDGEMYCVLIEDKEDADEYYIGRMVEDEDGDFYVETLEEDRVDEIYDAYEQLLDEFIASEAAEDDEEDEE